MEQKVIDAYVKAGKIASKARTYTKSLCADGALAVDIANKVESKIRSLGGEIAFPVDVSINEVAAHYTPSAGDKLTLKKGDLVKVDLGAQINGYIADTVACVSVGLDKSNNELISAASDALSAALKVLKPGVTLNEIGKAISGSVAGTDVKVIRNLTGHGLGQYEVHTSPSIFNFESGNMTELRDCAVAIEPFTTHGDGLVVDAKRSGIFRVERRKQVRVGRDVLAYVLKKYRSLPFSLRELVGKFGAMKARLAVRTMIASGVLTEYDVLRERSKSKVAQAEHTVLILDGKVIVTTK